MKFCNFDQRQQKNTQFTQNSPYMVKSYRFDSPRGGTTPLLLTILSHHTITKCHFWPQVIGIQFKFTFLTIPPNLRKIFTSFIELPPRMKRIWCISSCNASDFPFPTRAQKKKIISCPQQKLTRVRLNGTLTKNNQGFFSFLRNHRIEMNPLMRSWIQIVNSFSSRECHDLFFHFDDVLRESFQWF